MRIKCQLSVTACTLLHILKSLLKTCLWDILFYDWFSVQDTMPDDDEVDEIMQERDQVFDEHSGHGLYSYTLNISVIWQWFICFSNFETQKVILVQSKRIGIHINPIQIFLIKTKKPDHWTITLSIICVDWSVEKIWNEVLKKWDYLHISNYCCAIYKTVMSEEVTMFIHWLALSNSKLSWLVISGAGLWSHICYTLPGNYSLSYFFLH